MLLNCGAGEDSWESLGLKGDQTLSILKEINLEYSLGGWCWRWSSNTLVIWCEEPTHWKRLFDAEKDWEQKEKGWQRMRRLESIISSMKFEQTLGDSEGQGSRCATVYGLQSWTWLSGRTATHFLKPNTLSSFLYISFFPSIASLLPQAKQTTTPSVLLSSLIKTNIT